MPAVVAIANMYALRWSYVRIQPPGLTIRLNRRLEQTAVAGGMSEAANRSGSVFELRRRLSSLLSASIGALGPPGVRVQIVRERKIRIQFQSPLDRVRPFRQLVGGSLGKLAHHPACPSQASPGGCVPGIQRDTLLIQADRFRKPAEPLPAFVRPQVQVIRGRIGRRIVIELLPLTTVNAARATRPPRSPTSPPAEDVISSTCDAFDQISVPLGASTS